MKRIDPMSFVRAGEALGQLDALIADMERRHRDEAIARALKAEIEYQSWDSELLLDHTHSS